MMAESLLESELDLLGDVEEAQSKTDFLDEDALLGFPSQEKVTKPQEANRAQLANNEESEQLDYEEEEEEERKPPEKSESEPKPQTEAKVVESAKEQAAPSTTGGSKCFVNPKFRPRAANQSGPSRNGLPPSLFSCPIVPPPMMRPPVEVMAQSIMMNSLRPLVPPMNRPMGPMGGYGAPPIIPGMPPAVGMNPMMGGGMPQPQMSLPPPAIQQDGTVTFRMTIPAVQPRVTVVRAGMSSTPQAGDDWANMVDAFLNNPESRKRTSRGRSRSFSSRSRSYSTSSYSSSYSGSESDRSFSRSPSPRRHRSRRDGRRRNRVAPSSRKRPRDRDSRRSRENSSRPSKRRSSPRIDDLKNTIECAEAIGLDQEYVRKLEEQKREREEFQRRKHRQDHDSARHSNDSKKDSKREESSSTQRKNSTSRHSDRERSHQRNQSDSKAAQSSSSSSSVPSGRTRPYLAVVINNLGTLSDAYKRIKAIASAVGPAKKVWQTADDSVSVIFERHEHAKAFMLQYHMKSFNGITLNIGLEKVFLDLSSVP